jgi:hypothetical protein
MAVISSSSLQWFVTTFLTDFFGDVAMKAPSNLGFVLAFVVMLLAMLVLTLLVASADYSTPTAWSWRQIIAQSIPSTQTL